MSKKQFKMNVLDRDESEFTRTRAGDVRKVFHTQDATTHKFQQAREYTRALNATKLDKIFAKPFIAALDAHTDGIYALSKIPNQLPYVLAGDGDGVVKLWHLGTQQQLWTARAHLGRVRGLCSQPNGAYALSCAADKTIKLWDVHTRDESMSFTHSSGDHTTTILEQEPTQTFVGSGLFNGIDHHRKKSLFASCGESVDIWDPERTEPLHSFQWGADSLLNVKFNYVDLDVVASTGSDRAVVLYDIRTKTPLHKLSMFHMSNQLVWNPQEAYNFVIASEDSNLYTFDMRNMSKALIVHRDHVNAVLSVDFSPSGREFVSGGYDKSVRIWQSDQQKSREIYATKRMQRVFAVTFSQDDRYVVSGSDDANLRLWKAKASERLGVLNHRENDALQYQDKLKERYGQMKEVHSIATRQLTPKHIKIQQTTRKIKDRSRLRKLTNVAVSKGRDTIRQKPLRTERVSHTEK